MATPYHAPGRLLKATVPATGRATAEAVLTYPVIDREGDYVRPDGGDWSAARPPLVDWWHQVPIGTGAVRLKAVDLDGTTYTLPVGTTTFFEKAADLRGIDLKGYAEYECLDAAERIAEMVAAGAVNGVSLEFEPAGPLSHKPDAGAYWVIGKSQSRPAYHFEKWRGRGWAHAPESAHVNPGALVLAKALPPAVAEIAASGEWRGKLLPAVILKAFPRIRPEALTVATRIRKAGMGMDDANPLDDEQGYSDTPETPGDDPVDVTDPADDLPNEIKHSYDAAQGAHDLAEMLSGNMKRIVDKATRKKWAKCVGMLRQVAETLAAHGDGLHADVSGDMADEGVTGDDPEAGDDEEDDPDDTDDYTPEGSDLEADGPEDPDEDKPAKKPFGKAAILTDAAGLILTKAAYTPVRVVRLKKSQLRDVPAKPAADAELAAKLAQLEVVERRLRKAARTSRDLTGKN